MIIQYKKLHADAHDPYKKHETDFCWDLCALGDHVVYTYATIPTGLQIEIPQEHYGMILSRSGLAKDYGAFVLNAPGIIDAGYTGEVQIVLGNIEPDSAVSIHDGERIAQIAILPYKTTYMSRNDTLMFYSTRGSKGFGSTGY